MAIGPRALHYIITSQPITKPALVHNWCVTTVPSHDGACAYKLPRFGNVRAER